MRKLSPSVAALGLAASALLATVAFSQLGLFAVLELKGLDLLFVLRGSRPAPEQVVVVAIDEPSFAELKQQWPWPRSLHGELVRKLEEAGAKVVGMDILFAEESDPKEDESLAQALREAGNVMLARNLAQVSDPLFQYRQRVDPIPVLQRAAAGAGVPVLLLDVDGTARRTRLSLGEKSSFALLVAEAFLARQGISEPPLWASKASSTGVLRKPVLIDHIGPPRTVATASYYQALRYKELLPPGFFAGKVVLVGRSLVAVPEAQRLAGDTFMTPFSWLGMGPTSGVEIQATIVSNLLEGRFPKELVEMDRSLVLFLFLAPASLLLIRLKPVAGLLTTVALAGSFLILAYVIFLQAGIVLPIIAALAGLGLVYAAHLMLRAIQAERARRRALEEANRTLEAKVAARTRELSAAHQKLTDRHSDLQAAHQDLKRTQQQLVQSEKMASLGLLVAGVAHELNNPISYVHSNLDFVDEYTERLAGIVAECRQEREPVADGAERQVLQERAQRYDAARQTLQELIRSCKEGTERVKRIVLDLRAFSRTDDTGRAPADLHAGIESALNLLAKQYQDRIRVHRDYGELPDVECFPGQINQVFMNLLLNAVQAIPDQGDLWITTRADCEWVTVTIRDNGGGIAEEDLTRVFDPFFTTKPVGTGTGLGLSISYSIVEKHGGRIRAQSRVNEGTEFIIELPVRAAGGRNGSL